MKNTLKNKWGTFWNVIASPGSVVFSAVTVSELVISYLFKENLSFSTLLTVLAAVTGGIAGSFIKDDYVKLISENVLEKKGRSAIRNLRSIGKQIAHVRGWIEDFCKGRISAEQRRTLDEIDRHLSTAQMNIDSGFEDWMDIVPELAEAAEVTKRQDEVVQAYLEKLYQDTKELIASTDKVRTEELKSRISDLEKLIKRVQHAPTSWARSGTIFGGGSVIGSSGFGHGGSVTGVGFGSLHRCPKCKRMYPSNSVAHTCPYCGDTGTTDGVSQE